jgi:hypothetical protein
VPFASSRAEVDRSGLGPSGRETALAAALLFAVLAIPGFLFRSAVLWNRPLWLDEVHTLWVAGQRDLGSVFRALLRGADFNPPLLFVWQWTVGQVAGVSAATLRLTALASVWIALVLVFRFLRRTFGLVPSLAGALVLATELTLIRHAYEGRFYGPWLLLTAVYIGALSGAVDRPQSVAAQVRASAAAVALCLIHYFGIITLGLAVIGVGVARRNRWREIRVFAPSIIAGIAALAIVTPLYLGQRAALSVPTWVPRPSPSAALDFVRQALFPWPLAVLLLAGALTVLAPRLLGRPDTEAEAGQPTDARILGLVGMAGLPLVLVAFSFLVQPVTVTRYAMPAYLSLGPVAAFAVSRLRMPLALAATVGVGVAALLAGREVSARTRAEADALRVDSTAAAAVLAAGGTLAVARRHELYPLLVAFPNRGDRLVYATVPSADVTRRFPDGSDSVMRGRMVRLEQDVAGVHSRLFGRPRLVSADSLERIPCLFLLENADRPAYASRWMPRATATRASRRLFRITHDSLPPVNPLSCSP